MKKKIESYLHLYLPYNVKCETPHGGGIGIMCTYSVCGAFGFGMSPGYKEFMPEEGIRPILRPLSDMTEKERVECKASTTVRFGAHGLKYEKLEPDQFIKLLSKHLDVFGLIEAGLAIDKTKM